MVINLHNLNKLNPTDQDATIRKALLSTRRFSPKPKLPQRDFLDAFTIILIKRNAFLNSNQ